MEKTTPPPTRLQALDFLRAIAIFLVLGRHLAEETVVSMPASMRGFFEVWQRGGWIGVDLFFVLSGFLISGLLFREHGRFGTIRYGHFLARRGFKIYPPFFVMLAIVIGISLWHGRPFPPARLLLPEILFYQNYRPAIFPHAWSLAVEEHFYLLLPLVLIGLSRVKGRPFAALPWVFGAVATLVLTARLITAEAIPFGHKTHVFATHLRIDSLFFGVLISWLWHYHGEALRGFVERWRWPLAALAAGLALPPFFWEVSHGEQPFLHTYGFTALYVSAGIVLLLTLRLRAVWAPLGFIGAYSYSIYLWHMPIRLYLGYWGPKDWSPLASAFLYFGLSLGIGVLAAKLIETPFLILRDRLFPTRSHPLVAAAPEPAPAVGGGASVPVAS